MTTEEIKNYLRIDHTLDDNLIDNLYQSAREYVKNAIDVGVDVETFTKYKLFERASIAFNRSLVREPLSKCSDWRRYYKYSLRGDATDSAAARAVLLRQGA
ncbi:head-tail connector protein [Latilactobacillus sakei]